MQLSRRNPGRRISQGKCAVLPACAAKVELPQHAAAFSDWKPVLVQRLCYCAGVEKLHLDNPTAAEIHQATTATYPDDLGPLADPVPLGKETQRLHNWGYQSWRDLYPARQLNIYLEAAAKIREMTDIPQVIRNRLLLLLCGAPEMAGYSSRWDRFHGKAFEATANHRFSATPFAVEVNPLGARGRGTIPRRLKHSVKAAAWSAHNRVAGLFLPATIVVVSEATGDRLPTPGAPVIAVGTSERQLLPSGSVDLVLTDPPYHDDVQYGELARPFTAWAKRLGVIPVELTVNIEREALPNVHNQGDADAYPRILHRIFAEAARTLAPNGRFVLTYHNTDPFAWATLGQALAKANLHIVALAAVHAENETDHAKRGRRSFSKDLVIECCTTATIAPVVACTPAPGEEQELVAMGLALASQPGSDVETLMRDFTARVPLGTERLIRSS